MVEAISTQSEAGRWESDREETSFASGNCAGARAVNRVTEQAQPDGYPGFDIFRSLKRPPEPLTLV